MKQATVYNIVIFGTPGVRFSVTVDDSNEKILSADPGHESLEGCTISDVQRIVEDAGGTCVPKSAVLA